MIFPVYVLLIISFGHNIIVKFSLVNYDAGKSLQRSGVQGSP